MKTLTSHQRRILADNDIPAALKELLGSLAAVLTRDSFQAEISKRLGALLRVAGIDLQIVPHDPDHPDDDCVTPLHVRLPLQFADGTYDLVFFFGLVQLSERSKAGIYETATTILTDLLKVVTLSGPAALRRFRTQTRERRIQRPGTEPTGTLSETAPSDVASKDSSESPAIPYNPPYSPTKFAHRLRNLLAAIMSGSSQLAFENLSGLSDDDLMLVKMIDSAATMQADLIKRYLMTYGPMRLALRPLDFGTAIRTATKSHDSEFGCETGITGEGGATEVISDAEIIRQIIIEVLRNAHEASNGEAVTLRWTIAERRALIMVRNRGDVGGVDFERVCCEPFFTTKSGHSGLGLSIARRYAGYLGGTIRGLSLHGHTIVTICLPLTQNETVDL